MASSNRGSRRVRAKQSRARGGRAARWRRASEGLLNEGKKKRFATVEPKQVAKEVEEGKAVLVDVRPPEKYEACTAKGAKNIPLFQQVEGRDGASLLKSLLLQSLNVTPVEENEEFAEQLKELGAEKVILACAEGGTLEASLPSFPYGKESRSLLSAHRAVEETDIKNIAVLNGGLNAWFRAGMASQGEGEWAFDAKTPSSAAYSGLSKEEAEEMKEKGKDRKAKSTGKSGTLLKDGGSALDPFGTWSMALKGKEDEKEK